MRFERKEIEIFTIVQNYINIVIETSGFGFRRVTFWTKSEK